MRNQDGGGHVDAIISNADYVQFKTDGDPLLRQINKGIVFGEGAVGEPVANGLPATIQQIAWEVDQSLIKIGLSIRRRQQCSQVPFRSSSILTINLVCARQTAPVLFKSLIVRLPYRRCAALRSIMSISSLTRIAFYLD